MKKHSILFISILSGGMLMPTFLIRIMTIVLIIFSGSASFSQVSVVLNITLDEFSLSGTSNWFISITNSASKSYNCYLHATITVPGEGIIADGVSKSFVLDPFETRINQHNGAEVADSNKIDYDKSYREWYARNNALPSRNYTICLEVIELSTGLILATACQDLEPQKYRPPVNIYPFDRDTILSNGLSFQWLPSQPYNPEMTYSIRVVEILSIQSSVSAFYSNNYFYTEDYLRTPVLQYPIHARPLEEGRTYAWLVEGRIGDLELKSEPTVFIVGTPAIPIAQKIEKTGAHYSQYIDLMSFNAREIQIINGEQIPLIVYNKGGPYQLIYCITGKEQNFIMKGKILVQNGYNKLLIPASNLKEGPDEIYHLKLFTSTTDLPEIRFKQSGTSKK